MANIQEHIRRSAHRRPRAAEGTMGINQGAGMHGEVRGTSARIARGVAVALLAVLGAASAQSSMPSAAETNLVGVLPAHVPGQSATRLADGRWLLVGGSRDPGSIVTLNALGAPDRSTALKLQQPRMGHTATLLPDGSVLIFGGTSSRGSVLDTAERYDPAGATVSAIGGIGLLPRSGHTATVLADGNLLVV
ncbi:MAG: kelch repeat-containing protein, partial [Solimonas sp.]